MSTPVTCPETRQSVPCGLPQGHLGSCVWSKEPLCGNHSIWLREYCGRPAGHLGSHAVLTEPDDGGQWWEAPYAYDPGHGNSGPGGPLGYEIEAGTARHAADRRPEFSPHFLAAEVIRLLREHDVTVDPASGEMATASIAAADLLRALGVRPANAPERRRP